MDVTTLLRSIPGIKARLPDMTREELVRVWQNTVEAQARISDPTFQSAAGQLLDAVDTEFAAPKRRGEKDFLQEGPLGFLGYHVGRRAGLSSAQRRARLSAIYRRQIPRVFPPQYLAEWGEPGTSKRLQRMAQTISGFIHDPKWRKDPRMEDAIAEWKDDLEYLHRTHYRGGFFWPDS